MTACLADPLAVSCLYCGAKPGVRCMTVSGWAGKISGWARKFHAVRVRLALVLAAHADPVLDEFFPDCGPCLICGVEGLGARHRMIDGIAGRLAAGEDPGTVVLDYTRPLEAVEVVAEWAARWPGAWL